MAEFGGSWSQNFQANSMEGVAAGPTYTPYDAMSASSFSMLQNGGMTVAQQKGFGAMLGSPSPYLIGGPFDGTHIGAFDPPECVYRGIQIIQK